MKQIRFLLGLFVVLFVFSCCKNESIYDHFGPEILYKRSVVTANGMQWQVSPDAVDITLDDTTTAFTVYARISAPNGLNKVTIYEVQSGVEIELMSYNESDEIFVSNPNVYELSYTFLDISIKKIVRITAIDMIGNKTTRDFTIKK